MVYFIQCNDDVKIGYSTDVRKRLQALQTGSATTLTLLGTMEGDRATERYLHSIFAADRLQGEWFKLSQHIHDFIVASCDIPEAGEDRADMSSELDPHDIELGNFLLAGAGSYTFNKPIDSQTSKVFRRRADK